MMPAHRFGLTTAAMRRAAYVIGTLIFVASLVFVAAYAHRNWDSVRTIELVHPMLVLLSAALYGISHVSTGLSWPLALRRLDTPISLRTGLQIGLIAQIGKYMPGNVAHYFGRATLSAGVGISVKTTGISTIVEIVSAILAAAIVALIAMAISPATATFVSTQLSQAAPTIVPLFSILLIAVAALIIRHYAKGTGLRVLVAPTACLGVSFMLSGLSFTALIGAMGMPADPPAAIAVFAIAWLAGFLVPGSPAGLGVREAILIAFIAPQLGTAPAIACALAHRMLTACVDLVAACAGYAWWILSKKKKSANDVLSGSPTSQG